jgi:predicted secreted protein
MPRRWRAAKRRSAMKHIGAIAGLLLIAGMQAAVAADADVKVLGFSPDGRYFAFEQRGTDASGSYTTTVPMDVAENRLVKGSTMTYANDDASKLKKIRTATARLLRKLKISPKGNLSVEVPDIQVGQFEEGSYKLLAVPSKWFGPESWLSIRQFKMVDRCRDTQTNPIGFSLALERKAAPPVQLAHDLTIPDSRGCPTGYRVVEAHARQLKDGPVALAVIVQTLGPGLEGGNRSFIALTTRVAADKK